MNIEDYRKFAENIKLPIGNNKEKYFKMLIVFSQDAYLEAKGDLKEKANIMFDLNEAMLPFLGW